MKKQTLAEVKTELARKYRHLAMITKSTPRRKNLLNKSQSYLKQVGKLS